MQVMLANGTSSNNYALSRRLPRLEETWITGAWAPQLPMTAVLETHSATIYVLHDIHQLDLDPAVAGFNIVVSGHSHKFGRSEQSGVLYINPGSAGPRRFHLPVTIARINLLQSPWHVEFIDLV